MRTVTCHSCKHAVPKDQATRVPVHDHRPYFDSRDREQERWFGPGPCKPTYIRVEISHEEHESYVYEFRTDRHGNVLPV